MSATPDPPATTVAMIVTGAGPVASAILLYYGAVWLAGPACWCLGLDSTFAARLGTNAASRKDMGAKIDKLVAAGCVVTQINANQL